MMKILIDIPKEFEVDYNTDRFAEFFQRCLADMCTCCGNYEWETAEMMEKAFAESRLYDPDKVVEQMEPINYTALYEQNEDFKRYVDRYCTKHRISVAEALQHYLVQMVGRQYKEQAETTIRKE